jgi:hypothetical protein
MAEKTARVTLLNVELSLDAQKSKKTAETAETAEVENVDEIDDEELDFDFDEEEHGIDEPEFDSDSEHKIDVSRTVQANTETITETFETAENGGQGAFVSGDVQLTKTTEKTSDKADIPQGQTSANSANRFSADQNSENKNTPQQQAAEKPVKPKRNYFER